jgi:O-antigen ligase
VRQRTPTDPAAADGGAALRARVFALLRWSLLCWACTYFALFAISGQTFLRSVAFGFALLLAVWLVLGTIFFDNEPIPLPDAGLGLAVAAWACWSAASLAWSVRPEYTRAELGTEVGWGLATAAVFFVAARSGPAFRALIATAVGAATLLAALAVGSALAAGGFDPQHALRRAHGGAGHFSTYIVLTLPLLPLLALPAPVGFGSSRRTVALLAAAVALLLFAARLTENRMLWVSLAVAALAAATLSAWRWRRRRNAASLRWTGALAALLLVLAGLFVDAAIQRTRTDFKPDTTLAQAIAEDPRLLLWEHTIEQIRQRPWAGFGFGKSILREELQASLGDPLLAHAHNLFVSRWLQTGAIGVATLVALLAAIAWRYGAFLRAADRTLAVVGLAGLTMLVAFVVKNVTDDFMIRSTGKEFWALNAILIGYGIRREIACRDASGPPGP